MFGHFKRGVVALEEILLVLKEIDTHQRTVYAENKKLSGEQLARIKETIEEQKNSQKSPEEMFESLFTIVGNKLNLPGIINKLGGGDNGK